MTDLELGDPFDPYDFQVADIQDLLAHDGSGFVVAETGAGKSLIATELGLEGDFDTRLVIAPRGTHKRVWTEGILRQDPNARVRRIDGSTAGKDAMNGLEWGEPGWYVVTPQLFTRWGFSGIRPDLVIADEAHLLSNRQAAGSKKLRDLKARARVVMSGTMVRNHEENFWALLRWVYAHRSDARDIADSNYERWVTEWMATRYDRFAPSNRVVTGEKEPGRLAREIPCYRQHFKRAECCQYHPQGFLADLPEPVHIVETVELTAEQKRLIDRMERTYVAWLEDQANGDRKAAVAKLPIVARTRLRQMTLAVPSFTEDGEIGFAPNAESPKLDRLIETYDRVNEPIVAATSSKKYAEFVVNRLRERKIRAFEWSSAASDRARDEALDEFERGGLDIIVGVTEAIGTGIDGLQKASGVLVSLERSQDLTSEIQLEGRLDRRGQKRAGGVAHYEILAEGSMDEDIVGKQLQRRLALNRTLRRAA